MSRTKGSSAQPGPQRWRQQPEQDANAYHGGQYSDPPTLQSGATHFPQHAFRHLSDRTGQATQARPAHTQQFQRPLAAQPGAGGHDRLTQRLQQGDPRAGWPTQQDPSGYDLAHYAPDQPAHIRGGQDPYAQDAYVDAAAEGWTGGGWNGATQGYVDPALGDHHYEADSHAQDYGYDVEEEDPAPRRGPRAYIVVSALVGAIAAGGGLAYAYKSLGNGASDGTTPVVRAERAPVKAKPSDPGGKEIAHTDKKFINRLNDEKSSPSRFDAAAAALSTSGNSSTENDGGPRKVTTLVVNRDGSMMAPNPSVALPQGGGSPIASGSVPGMVIDGLNAPQRPQLRGSSAPTENQAQNQAQSQSAPVKPQIIARATPAPEPQQPEAKKPAQREEAPVAARPPAKAVTIAAPAATNTGYVPVLSSQKTRMDALKAFADMQQKYTDVLQNRTPDVREVDLGERGVWHRLVVGPPASREAASSVCTQLKAHGYSGCWVVAY